MADYKEMYLKMVRASEEAMRILIAAQQACEELYLAAGEDPDSAEYEPEQTLLTQTPESDIVVA